MLESVPIPNAPPALRKPGPPKTPVAERALGQRAQPDDRPRSSEPGGLGPRHVRGVDDAPAAIDGHLVEEPFDRAAPAPCQALLHLPRLLGRMDVDRPFRHQAGHGPQGVGRDGPQGMGRDTDPGAGQADRVPARALEDAAEPVEIGQEAPLPRVRRRPSESALRVERRQQGQPDPDRRRGGDDPTGHLARICVGAAVGSVVEVVELAHQREAALQHLQIREGRDRLHVVRREPGEKPVHDITPRPERVARRTPPLGEPGHPALERVRMEVGKPRDRDPGWCRADGRVRLDRHDDAVLDADPDPLREAARQKRVLEDEVSDHCPVMSVRGLDRKRPTGLGGSGLDLSHQGRAARPRQAAVRAPARPGRVDPHGRAEAAQETGSRQNHQETRHGDAPLQHAMNLPSSGKRKINDRHIRVNPAFTDSHGTSRTSPPALTRPLPPGDSLRAQEATSMAGPKEIELKLELDPSVTRAETHRILRSVVATSGETRRLRSRYFDTSRQALRKHGRTLRVRQDGARRVQTLKSGIAGGIFERGEWESEVAGEAPDLDALPNPDLARDIADLGPLQPVFETDVQRTIWDIRRGRTRVELAYDEGRVAAGERTDPIREIELELKAGTARELFRLASTMATAGPVRIGVRSKSERGYGLLKLRPERPEKAGKLELDRDIDAGQAFRAVAWSCLRHFRLNEAILLARQDVEALHQARVAVRRLRSAFTLFKAVILCDEWARLKRELRSVSRVLGDARNLDVYRTRTLAGEVDSHPDEPGLADLVARIEEDRESAYAKVLRRLRAKRFRMLMIDLAAFVEAGPWLSDEAQKDLREAPAAAFAARILDKRRRPVAKEGRHLDRLDPTDRHRLRIEAKKLRYACEFFGSLSEGRKAKRQRKHFVGALEDLQTCLGELNDIATGHEMAAALARRPNGAEPGPILFAAGHVSGEQDARQDECLACAVAAQRRVRKAKRFWA